MSSADDTRAAFAELHTALAEILPELVGELRPAVPFDVPWRDRAGAEEVLALWATTSGQADGMLGVCGGMRLLGPHDSETERAKWSELLDGPGLDAVAHPSWDASSSLDPEAVRGVYFAAGWIPVLCEPLEADYLAVDLAPLPGGRAGQIIVCGRDEDEKLVVTPDLATLLRGLAAECRLGLWELASTEAKQGPMRYMSRTRGRLLSACRERTFPPRLG